jgi:hypothetical protein
MIDARRVAVAKHRRCSLFVLAIACGAAIAFPPRATASWGWEGTVGWGRGNGSCSLYSGQSACSYYAYWDRINAYSKPISGFGYATVLAGFENSTTIRGVYMAPGDERVVYASALYMGGWYIQGQVTWCTWAPQCDTGGAYADVWFRVYP